MRGFTYVLVPALSLINMGANAATIANAMAARSAPGSFDPNPFEFREVGAQRVRQFHTADYASNTTPDDQSIPGTAQTEAPLDRRVLSAEGQPAVNDGINTLSEDAKNVGPTTARRQANSNPLVGDVFTGNSPSLSSRMEAQPAVNDGINTLSEDAKNVGPTAARRQANSNPLVGDVFTGNSPSLSSRMEAQPAVNDGINILSEDAKNVGPTAARRQVNNNPLAGDVFTGNSPSLSSRTKAEPRAKEVDDNTSEDYSEDTADLGSRTDMTVPVASDPNTVNNLANGLYSSRRAVKRDDTSLPSMDNLPVDEEKEEEEEDPSESGEESFEDLD